MIDFSKKLNLEAEHMIDFSKNLNLEAEPWRPTFNLQGCPRITN